MTSGAVALVLSSGGPGPPLLFSEDGAWLGLTSARLPPIADGKERVRLTTADPLTKRNSYPGFRDEPGLNCSLEKTQVSLKGPEDPRLGVVLHN